VPDTQRLIGRLADAGEDAIQKMGDVPGVQRFLTTLNTLPERLEEIQRKLRGVEELERRLTRLEKRVDELAKPKRPASSSSKPRSPAKSSTKSSSSGSSSSSG
jgi:hypothetical protein